MTHFTCEGYCLVLLRVTKAFKRTIEIADVRDCIGAICELNNILSLRKLIQYKLDSKSLHVSAIVLCFALLCRKYCT